MISIDGGSKHLMISSIVDGVEIKRDSIRISLKNPINLTGVNQGMQLFDSKEGWLRTLLESRTNGSGPRIFISVPFASYNYFADREFLHAEYALNKKSAKTIARECCCSHSTILKYLREFGFEIRSSCKRYPQGQLPFGMELVEGKIQVNKVETEIIEKMEILRAKGFSLRRIAYVLNTLEIPTKHKNARWHATTVMKILGNHGRLHPNNS